MEQAEIEIFIILATSIVLLFLIGIFIFIIQYNKRRLIFENEKIRAEENYKQEILNIQMRIQQQTMQDIGREIHDGALQQLTLAMIQANQLIDIIDNPDAKTQTFEIVQIINDSINEMRLLSRTLANPNTETKGLKELIDEVCNKITALKTIHIQTNFNYDYLETNNHSKNFILRIIQEFIQNSLKHSECKNITLNFNVVEEIFVVEALDDGRGFDMKKYYLNEKKGIGLENMKNRTELIGGTFTIKSELENGTQITLCIPCEKLIN